MSMHKLPLFPIENPLFVTSISFNCLYESYFRLYTRREHEEAREHEEPRELDRENERERGLGSQREKR